MNTSRESQREKKIKRLRKLILLARDQEGLPEGRLAATRAATLRAELGLSGVDVEAAEVIFSPMDEEVEGFSSELAFVIAVLFDIEFEIRPTEKPLLFRGLPENVERAMRFFYGLRAVAVIQSRSYSFIDFDQHYSLERIDLRDQCYSFSVVLGVMERAGLSDVMAPEVTLYDPHDAPVGSPPPGSSTGEHDDEEGAPLPPEDAELLPPPGMIIEDVDAVVEEAMELGRTYEAPMEIAVSLERNMIEASGGAA